MATNPIRPALFDFLRDLAENNTREWFAENKERYEAEVREPLRAFVREFEPHLFRLSEQFVADDRKSGGSVFRIQRDTRFSHDKRPYKTNAGLHFRHAKATKEVHAPGFYLHLEPGNVFAGVGAWLPDATALRAVRTAIVEQPSVWREATQMGKYWQVSRDCSFE
ncbi:TIGR02453 family protein [bacterium]|nr:TIGR02453 family protein [bacterium]